MALVLQRQIGESVLSGNHLEVTLERVHGQRVNPAIEPRPTGGRVHRTPIGPTARLDIGPVAIQARRQPSRSRNAARLTFSAPRPLQIARREPLSAAAAT